MPYEVGTSQPGLTAADGVFGRDPRTRYSPGEYAKTQAGTVVARGYARSFWTFDYLERANWDTYKTTYLGGEYSAATFISTRDDEDDFADYSVIAILPNPETLERSVASGGVDVYLNVEIEFILIEDVTP